MNNDGLVRREGSVAVLCVAACKTRAVKSKRTNIIEELHRRIAAFKNIA